jgi:hypothetical protein
MQLAAMHYNENADRGQANTKDGQPQFKFSFPKSRQDQATVRIVKENSQFGMH